jgi:hypothetical protein
MNPDTDFPNLKATLAGNGSHVEWPAMREEVRRVFALISEGSKWRCAKTDRPPENQPVLIWYRASHPGWRVYVGEVSCGHWRPEGGNGNFDGDITHWMPFPEAPK